MHKGKCFVKIEAFVSRWPDPRFHLQCPLYKTPAVHCPGSARGQGRGSGQPPLRSCSSSRFPRGSEVIY